MRSFKTGVAWYAGIGKSHLAALVVAQLLLLGRVVLLELVGSTADIKRQFFRLQLTSGEFLPTIPPSWLADADAAATLPLPMATASFSCAEGKAIVHSVSNSEDAMEWLMYDTQAVTDVKDLEEFAPAYVVDGGMPSKYHQCTTLVYLRPAPMQCRLTPSIMLYD